MICPFCNSQDLDVINTRPTKNNKEIWRRRKCLECEEIFTTYEKISLDYLKVSKRNKKTVRYDRSKLYSGIYRASLQTKGADYGDMAKLSEEVTNEIENKIIDFKLTSITTSDLKDLVLKRLKKKSLSLFLSYIAYFKSKTTLEDFKRYINEK